MQAQCPSCGSSLSFKSEQSAYVVCSACQTLVARKNLDVQSVGKVASLQPDGSLLRVGTQGVWNGKSFEIIGRIQVALGPLDRPDVIWNEWHAAFSHGVSGWIGEALGQYFVSFAEPGKGAPALGQISLGQVLDLNGFKAAVTSIATGTALGFEGELPFVMSTEYAATFVDLLSAEGLSATLDYSENPPILFRGHWCGFDELKLSGLRYADEEGSGPRLAEANLKSLKCASCGAPHELQAGGLSQTLVCGFCDAVMDLNQDATFKDVLSFQQAQNKVPAVIPLGSTGTLPGLAKPVRCIGYMRRSCRVDGKTYAWSEYLLYEPTQGYAWLTESRGHWCLLQALHKLPTNLYGTPAGYPPRAELKFENNIYRHFQKTQATVDYVAGEFYWRVRAGEVSEVDDYVCPPLLLSADTGGSEVNWSHGAYLTGAQVYAGFKLPGTVLGAHGVANNQPNPHKANSKSRWVAYFLALGVAFSFLIWRGATEPAPITGQSWTYKTDEPEHSKIADIDIPPGVHNVRFTVNVPGGLDQRWAFFQLSLIDEEKHLAFDTGVTLYQESGMDEGERWVESKTSDTATLSQVPGGHYLLRVDPQSNKTFAQEPEKPTPGSNPLLGSPLFSFNVKVERDVAQWDYFFMLLLLGLIPPLWSTWRSSAFETSRWSESDYAPDAGSDDE